MPLSHNLMLQGRLTLIKDQSKPTDKKALKQVLDNRKALRFQKQDEEDEAPKTVKEQKAQEREMQMAKEERAKHIDFKEKAIKAKEGAMKKMLSACRERRNSYFGVGKIYSTAN